MRVKVVRIGNSQGVRIPKGILDSCGIRDQVELSVEEGRLIMEPLRQVRQGWAEAAELMASRGHDGLLDPETSTEFDETNWEW